MSSLPPKELNGYDNNIFPKIASASLAACGLIAAFANGISPISMSSVLPYSSVGYTFLDDVSSKLDVEVVEVTATLHSAGIDSATVEKVEKDTKNISLDNDPQLVFNTFSLIPYAEAAPMKTIQMESAIEEEKPSISSEIQIEQTESNSPLVEENKNSTYYVMFATRDGEKAASTSAKKDTILVKVENGDDVSVMSYNKDLRVQEPENVEQPSPVEIAITTGDRDQIRDAIEESANIDIEYYATVNEYYLNELEHLIEENSESTAEWALYQAEKLEAERIAAEEAAKPKTIINDELWFNQNDFSGYYYQDYFDIPSYGCGLCSTTVALNMLLNEDWEPVYVANRMQSYADAHGHIQYCVYAGTSYPQWQHVIEGEFGVEIRKATSVQDAKDALSQGKMIFAGNGGNVFKDSNLNKHWHGGHIVCFYKTNGESVWAKDPAGCGGASVEYTATDFQQWWDWGGSNRMYIISRAGE